MEPRTIVRTNFGLYSKIGLHIFVMNFKVIIKPIKAHQCRSPTPYIIQTFFVNPVKDMSLLNRSSLYDRPRQAISTGFPFASSP